VIEDNKSVQENYSNSLQFHIADFISALIGRKKLDQARVLLDDNLKLYPDFLPLLKTNVNYFCREAETNKNFVAVVKAADLLISHIDENDLATFFGLKHEEDQNLVKAKDLLKQMLTSTYQQKAEALLELYQVSHEANDKEAFFKAFGDLNKWTKNNVEIPNKLQVNYERLKGNLGAALKLLKKRAETANDKETNAEMVEIFKELGWHHWVQNKSQSQIIQFPHDFALF